MEERKEEWQEMMSERGCHIAAVLTCHNRREKTLACLRSLRAAAAALDVANSAFPAEPKTSNLFTVPPILPADPVAQIPNSHFRVSNSQAKQPKTSNWRQTTLRVYLVDDGSTDGTSDAVRALWPDVTVIPGDGNLFWCGGMRVGWAKAAESDPDFYLLVNDDTTLYPDAVVEMLKIVQSPVERIIAAGAVCDPVTKKWTYGGVQSDFDFPMFDGSPRPCRTLNMNAALVPRAVFREIGILHGAFRHAMGDMDYGLRATERKIAILETPRLVGECSDNPQDGTWRDVKLGRWKRLRKLTGVKGLPPRDWLVYTRRNCGAQWWRYFASPYIRIITGK